MTYINNVTDTLFADVSYYQNPVDDSYLDAGYQVLSIRSNDGTFRDPNFARNYQWCVANCDNGRLKFFIVYFYWRPGAGDVDTHIDMVNSQGGPHPRMVTMIDLESGGNPGGDQSFELNAEYRRLVDWLGSDQRVIGYGNQSDLRTMWQFPGSQIDVIVAGYGANPSSPNPNLIKVAHQYTDGQGYGGGLPEGAPPFGNCDMNSADGLSVEAFAMMCGITLPGGPPPGQPPPPPPSEGYGVPTGSAINYGMPGFPQWVYDLGAAFNLRASTYPGHQENNRVEAGYAPNPQRLNRGIDWTGSVDDMQRFAEYCFSIRGSLEQVIWQNPITRQRIGVAGGQDVTNTPYYADDYGGHTDHVHTRQSKPIPLPSRPPVTPPTTPGSPVGPDGGVFNASTDTVRQPDLTERGAIQAILWKTNAAVDMRGTDGPSRRPFNPGVSDDLLGHMLSSRAEQLQTQALLSALITALVSAKVIPPIDQVGILASIKEQF